MFTMTGLYNVKRLIVVSPNCAMFEWLLQSGVHCDLLYLFLEQNMRGGHAKP